MQGIWLKRTVPYSEKTGRVCLPVLKIAVIVDRKARIQNTGTQEDPEQEDDEDEQFVCFIQLSFQNVVYIIRPFVELVNT